MPYPGIPGSLTARMDRCVTSVSAEPKMQSKYPDAKERKSHAIAICHSSIVDSQKIENLINDLVKGKEVNYKMKEDILEDFAKLYETEGLEAFSDADFGKLAPDDMDKAAFSTCIRGKVKSGMNFKEAAKACQMGAKAEDEGKEEDETKAKKADGDSEKVEEDEAKVEKAKKAKKVAPKADDEEAEEQEDEDEEAKAPKKDAKKAEESEAISIMGVLKEAMGSEDVSQMKEALKKAQAFLVQTYGELKPVGDKKNEGLLSSEKVDKVEGAKALIAEVIAKLDDATKDENPALAKLDSVLEKVDGIAKSVADQNQKLDDMGKRLDVVEKQPVDSKVSSTAVVVKKDQSVEEDGRVKEINAELKKLEDVKTYDMNKYQNERMWEKAFDLIGERDQLLAKV